MCKKPFESELERFPGYLIVSSSWYSSLVVPVVQFSSRSGKASLKRPLLFFIFFYYDDRKVQQEIEAYRKTIGEYL